MKLLLIAAAAFLIVALALLVLALNYTESPACFEGHCAFGDKTRTIRFTCSTGAGAITRRAKVNVRDGLPRGIDFGDMMQIEADDGTFETCPYGQLTFVNGTWYDITASADATHVTATPLKEPCGKVKIDGDREFAMLIDTDRILGIEADKEAVNVPAGKYYVFNATVRRGEMQIATLEPSSFRGQGQAHRSRRRQDGGDRDRVLAEGRPGGRDDGPRGDLDARDPRCRRPERRPH